MDNVSLFSAAGQKLGYLFRRENIIAANVANANTPGFRPIDIRPGPAMEFGLALTLSDQGHLDAVDRSGVSNLKAFRPTDPWETSISGNSVSLEQELIKSNEVLRAGSLNASIVRVFQKITLANVRG
jgi:flagellar basal-body rod protein FlgB